METSLDRVTDYDVKLAYELMLGRPPESAQMVARHRDSVSSLQELRALFIASQEFRNRIRSDLKTVFPTHKPLNWPQIEIEVDVSAETLAAMLRHVEGNWAILGEKEPHWSVLSAERFKAASIADNIDEFYESGKRAVSLFVRAAERSNVGVRNLRRCLELGCGVGRLSIWLARMFPELIATDISPSHLRLASEAMQWNGLTNVDLRLINAISKIELLPQFDCFISLIVLQHNPPPVIAFLLRTILGKLAPGGLAYFQVPTYRRDAAFNSARYLAGASVTGTIEMHVIPQAFLWPLIDEADCRLLEVREDDWAGPGDVISNSILLRKRI